MEQNEHRLLQLTLEQLSCKIKIESLIEVKKPFGKQGGLSSVVLISQTNVASVGSAVKSAPTYMFFHYLKQYKQNYDIPIEGQSSGIYQISKCCCAAWVVYSYEQY